MRKSTRTISGVTPLAVMARPVSCPGKCLYCPTYPDAPQSYTPESPAVIRARTCDYDARRQVELRLQVFEEMGHPTDKIELIIMGGTFLAQPEDYQHRFVRDCYDGLNGTDSPTLEAAKKYNETARHRCTGLCIETRPDWCGQAEIQRMFEFGATRVELGVQTLDDDIFRLVGRGHGVAEVARATALLREHGFKVYYHWMPGLPGSTPEKDLEMSRRLFEDTRFRPDGLKLYPTMVVAGTGLESWYREGRYVPYDDDIMVKLIIGIKSIVPEYVRISRVLRDIPSKFIVAGLKDSLRDVVRDRMKRDGVECRCTRCREYGHRVRDGRKTGAPRLVRRDYDASGGTEVFLSFEDDGGTLFGLLRLRLQPGPVPALRHLDNGKSAVIRELHVFGPEVPLSEKRSEAAQHKGLGKALLLEAERIARDEFRSGRMFVLSGTGAREYYRESGYTLQGDYMVKELGTLA
ncbi:MAG: tRNA uridine(34) 5-carboxymethylaminomethyl modification radical SAM/GNAT enzyme Elp3 [Chloroflexi bacterium RBG_16_56_11]|nr:MAG: tRNA uridine(34) 5-carboxymethylaminomethyl modification radical SAM/GNAT enzyme Elp3 [Chloroflexi bacterium RBG_16_56_11]